MVFKNSEFFTCATSFDCILNIWCWGLSFRCVLMSFYLLLYAMLEFEMNVVWSQSFSKWDFFALEIVFGCLRITSLFFWKPLSLVYCSWVTIWMYAASLIYISLLTSWFFLFIEKFKCVDRMATMSRLVLRNTQSLKCFDAVLAFWACCTASNALLKRVLFLAKFVVLVCLAFDLDYLSLLCWLYLEVYKILEVFWRELASNGDVHRGWG